jgi:hypothetical protein
MQSRAIVWVVAITATGCKPSSQLSLAHASAAQPLADEPRALRSAAVAGREVTAALVTVPTAASAAPGADVAWMTATQTAPVSGTITGHALSQDGRYVCMTSIIEPGSTSPRQVMLWDRATGTTTVLSTGRDGNPANADASNAFISADGRVVAFESAATKLTADVSTVVPAPSSVFVYDRDLGKLELASRRGDGGRAAAQLAGLSADGRRVLMASAEHLGPNRLAAGASTLYLLDRDAGAISTAAVDFRGGAVGAVHGLLSANGRFVLFDTIDAAVAAAAPDPVASEVLVRRDLATGAIDLVPGAAGIPVGLCGFEPLYVSDDGNTVLYSAVVDITWPFHGYLFRQVDVDFETTRELNVPVGDWTLFLAISVSRDGRVLGVGETMSWHLGSIYGQPPVSQIYLRVGESETVLASPDPALHAADTIAVSGDGGQIVYGAVDAAGGYRLVAQPTPVLAGRP